MRAAQIDKLVAVLDVVCSLLLHAPVPGLHPVMRIVTHVPPSCPARAAHLPLVLDAHAHCPFPATYVPLSCPARAAHIDKLMAVLGAMHS